MTPHDVVISGVGLICWAGEGPEGLAALLAGLEPPPLEEVEEGVTVPVGRIGRIRNHPFSMRYDRFGQIDTFSRYGFIAAGHALDSAGLAAPHEDLVTGGAILGTGFGCQEANQQFDQFSLDPAVGLRGASPMMFKGTVDNAPAGWVAVAYKFKGPNATFVSGPGAGNEAVMAGAAAIRAGRAPFVVTGGLERLIPLQIAACYREDPVPTPFLAEGAAVLVLESAAAAQRRGHSPLARLVASARIPQWQGVAGLVDFLERAGCPPEDIAQVGCSTPSPSDAQLLSGLLAGVGVVHEPQVLARRAGEMVAGGGPLALIGLTSRLRAGERGLVLGSGEANETFAFLIEAG